MSRVKWWELEVSFTTPAFLGGPSGDAQWRTPPFKALFRQWWRVAYARGRAPAPSELFEAESALFGRAADAGTTASQVRFRLDWRPEAEPLAKWRDYRFGSLVHPEVKQPVRADLYLAYGPVSTQGAQRSFLPPGVGQTLRIGLPEDREAQFRDVLLLIQLFGTVGGRSRNGWGSVHLDGDPLGDADLSRFLDRDPAAREWLRPFSRAWNQAIGGDTDWCHALGTDETGFLLWRTREEPSWEQVLDAWGEAKVAFRTQFRFSEPGTPSGLQKRHLLAYPVTRHAYRGALRGNAWHRSANQVVFKVLQTPKGYVGLAAHLPHALPQRLRAGIPCEERDRARQMELEVWPRVHEKLDKMLTRLA